MLNSITKVLCSHIFRVGMPLFFLFKIEALMATSYGSFSSIVTQTPSSAGTNLVIMDQADEMLNIELSPKKDKIIIKEDGVYLIIATGEVGAITTGIVGYMDLWFLKNDKPIANSGNRVAITDSSQISMVVAQIALSLKAGDTIAAGFSASGPSLGFIFIQPDNEPAMTSYDLTIIKISEDTRKTTSMTKPSIKK